MTPISFEVLVLLVVLALAFDFMNGFHDAANSIATIVSTRVLRPQFAVAWAAFFNFIAFLFFGLAVANTIGTGVIDAWVVDQYVLFGALVGAIAWNVITWWFGIPSSSSHALIGGLAGAAVAKGGFGALVGSGFLKITLAIVASPMLGFALGMLLMTTVAWIFQKHAPHRIDRWFRRLQLVSAALYSLGHGGNDAQKTMGIIALLLAAHGSLQARLRRVRRPALGRAVVPGGDGARHAVRRLAHRQDDGHEDHQAQAGRRLLRRDRRGDDAVPRHRARHPGVDDAHDHRRHRRRRRDEQAVRRALGRGRPDRAGRGC